MGLPDICQFLARHIRLVEGYFFGRHAESLEGIGGLADELIFLTTSKRDPPTGNDIPARIRKTSKSIAHPKIRSNQGWIWISGKGSLRPGRRCRATKRERTMNGNNPKTNEVLRTISNPADSILACRS